MHYALIEIYRCLIILLMNYKPSFFFFGMSKQRLISQTEREKEGIT